MSAAARPGPEELETAAESHETADPDRNPTPALTDPWDEPDEPQLDLPSGDHPARRESDPSAATELARLRRNYSRASTYHAQSASIASKKPTSFLGRGQYNLRKFWRNQVSVTVDHDNCRDHLALERTFLGYLRTSLALSMLGVTIAQLFRLQHAPTPNKHFGFYVLGKPLSFICQGAAIFTLFIGAFRSWRSQNAIVRGKAISGGFEIVFLAGLIFLMLIVFFVLLVAVDIVKEDI